jgi:hypothetical protein
MTTGSGLSALGLSIHQWSVIQLKKRIIRTREGGRNSGFAPIVVETARAQKEVFRLEKRCMAWQFERNADAPFETQETHRAWPNRSNEDGTRRIISPLLALAALCFLRPP